MFLPSCFFFKNMLCLKIVNMKTQTINREKLVEALKEGKDIVDAGILAGSKSKNVRKDIRNLLKNDPALKRSVIDILAEKQRILINAITRKEIQKASLKDKATAFGILTDKLQVMKGEADRRIELVPRIVYDKNKVKFTTDTREIEAIETPLLAQAQTIKDILADDIKRSKRIGAKLTADILREDNLNDPE